jgi:tripartite-type tricarboxylate transporter receptor subunit TctC
MKTIKLGALLLAVAAATTTTLAKADEYPSKAINVLVGFSAGGGTDVYARNLGVTISKFLNNQPFVVVNKAGGAQIPAMKVLKSSDPDGYSAMIVSMGSAIIATGLRDRGVDLFKDFELVAQYGVTNIMVAASKEAGFKTPEDVIEGIKKAHAKGIKLRWGSAGRASITTLAMIAWLNKHGVYEMTQDIPFKGGAKVRAALIGNNVDFGSLGTSNASAYKDKINIIATFSGSRDPAQPNIPTLGDLKSDYVPMETPIILAVPKGTPKDIVAKLESAVRLSTEDPEFKDRSTRAGQSVVYRGSKDLRKFAEGLKHSWDETIMVVRKRMAEAKN